MEQNKIYHLDFLNNTLPDKCADLIIADPPYFEVKGEFDFIWSSFEEYLKDVEKWAIECKRILKENGTLIYYGDSKKIAYSQIIFDKYFDLVSNVTIHIFDRQTNKIKTEDARGFINTTERFLMYSNDCDKTGLQEINNDKTLYKSIRDYFLEQKKNSPYSFKEINQICFGSASNGGGMASNILTSYKDGWTFPTKEKYEALQKIGICPKPYDELKYEYDKLQSEYNEIKIRYESLRRPFNPTEEFKIDVLRFSQEGHNTGKYDHPTVKPEKLTRYLIQTCSRENDLVIVPFAGSGTECAMALKEKRNFIGFEIDEKNVKTATKRVNEIIKNPTLF